MAESVMSPTPPSGPTAGAMLRAAREQQGLHIAALGAAIKVPVAKLEALESDQYALLPDVAFTRALAQAMCRALKIDPQPVLARLPHADPAALDQVAGTLNTPFRERASRAGPSLDLRAARPMAWGGALLLVAAAVVYFLPSGVWTGGQPAEAPASADVAAAPDAGEAEAPPPEGVQVPEVDPAASAALVTEPAATTASAPATALPAATAPQPASAAGPALVRLQADQGSWVQAQDAAGRTLLSRMVRAGESVDLDGALPIRLTIGNATATRLSFRGQPVDLVPLTRNAVARVELK